MVYCPNIENLSEITNPMKKAEPLAEPEKSRAPRGTRLPYHENYKIISSQERKQPSSSQTSSEGRMPTGLPQTRKNKYRLQYLSTKQIQRL